jgi:hypothetical protein
MNITFVIVDNSGGAPTADGASLTPEILANIASAVEIQLNRDFSPHWGGTYRVRVASGSDDVQPGEVPYIIKSTIDAPGAIADHYVNPDGSPAAEDATSLSDTLTSASNSCSVATSHEFLEVGADPPCNVWRDGGDGKEYCQEVGDPVEAQSYPITLDNGAVVYVSNFVTPAYFTPGAVGPYDYLSSIGDNPSEPAAPFQVPAGGNYQTERQAGQGEFVVQARYTGPDVTVSLTIPFASSRAHRRLPKRAHPSSRSYRRGLRVAPMSPDVTKSP